MLLSLNEKNHEQLPLHESNIVYTNEYARNYFEISKDEEFIAQAKNIFCEKSQAAHNNVQEDQESLNLYEWVNNRILALRTYRNTSTDFHGHSILPQYNESINGFEVRNNTPFLRKMNKNNK